MPISLQGSLYGAAATLEVLNIVGTELRVVGNIFENIPGPIMKAISFTRELKFGQFIFHTRDLWRRVIYLKSGKETLLSTIDLIRLSGALLEDSSMMIMGISTLKILSTKVIAVAGMLSFAGLAVQGVSIAIEGARIFQSVRELKRIDKDTAPYRVSHMALYRLKRGVIENSIQTPEFKNHLKNRLKWNIGFRGIAGLSSAVGLAAVGVLIFAPTPMAGVAWGLMGASGGISLILIIGKEIVYYKLDQQFKLVRFIPDEREIEAAKERKRRQAGHLIPAFHS